MDMIPTGTAVEVWLKVFRTDSSRGLCATVLEMGVAGVLLTWDASWDRAYPDKSYVPRKGATVFYPWHEIHALRLERGHTTIEEREAEDG